MSTYCNVTLLCAAVRDTELSQTKNGINVCNGRVVWATRSRDEDEKHYLNFKAWRGAAESLAEYAQKGKKLLLTGVLKQENWKDADGNNRQDYCLEVETFRFL